MKNVHNFAQFIWLNDFYIHYKQSHETSGALTNEREQTVACDPFNILLKTTKQILVMFSKWDECTSFGCSQSMLITFDPEKMSWFKIQWSTGHVGLDMSNDSGGFNCGGCYLKYL